MPGPNSVFFGEAIEQKADRLAANLIHRLTDRRQGRLKECAGVLIIKSGHGDFVRNAQPNLRQRADGAVGQTIMNRENGVKW